VTAREDFGEPLGSDLLLEAGCLYLRRGLLINAVRALLSGVPLDVAEGALQTVLTEIRSRHDAA
jgi:hypothetical protein